MARQPAASAQIVIGIVAVKFLVLLVIGRWFQLRTSELFLFAFALAQGGEFAFVLLSFATSEAVLTAEIANLLIASVALSMAAAPFCW